jgi:hypothetical protein
MPLAPIGALDHGCAAMQAQAIRPAVCRFKACAREDRVRVTGVLFFAILLAGCSISEKMVARQEADKSADNYKQCMAANATVPKRCEELRLAMEASERKWDSIDTDLIKPAEPDPDFGRPR